MKRATSHPRTFSYSDARPVDVWAIILILGLGLALLPLASCIGGGSGSSQSGLQCPDSPAIDAFEETVCICEDFADIGNLIVGTSVARDSATLAVNGRSVVLNNTQVRGTFKPHGGLVAKANVEVTEAIVSAGTVDAIGNIEAGTDMSIGDDLIGIGRLAVGGMLSVGGEDRFLGFKDVAGTVAYAGDPERPCGCGDSQIVDVVAAVDAARADNDNAAVGLPTSIADIGYQRIQFGSGEYYFDDVATIGATKFIIDGAVSIYIGGNLETIGAEWIHLNPGATLDLYVSGAVRTVGHVALGDKHAPSSFRLYIGGDQELSVNVGNNIFNGAIYAPRANLRYIGNTQVRGALFAKRLVGTGNLVVGYAAPDAPPDNCEPPEIEQPEQDPPPPEDDDPPVID